MKINKNTGFALMLILFGVMILFSSLGINILGGLMGYLVPIAMIALGWYGIKRGSNFFGWIILVIGIIALLGKLTWLFGLLLAVGIIAVGVSMLKKRHSY